MTPKVTVSEYGVSFTAGMVIDGDGSPKCYAPRGSGLPALDYLANAMNGDRYVGVVCIGGEPVIQQSGDCAGYYLSPTALVDRGRTIVDPARYVDSELVPYVSICPELRQYRVDLGDLATVLYNGKMCGAIIADISPHNHYGEASIACAEALGIPSSPKNGGVSDGVTYVLFPMTRTSPPWPRDVQEIQQSAELLYNTWSNTPQSPA